MKKLQQTLKNEDGSTLIETLVAMAILVSVLLPAGLFLGYMSNRPRNEEKILALGLAQSAMERALAGKDYAAHESEIDSRWIVRQTTRQQERLVQINIIVYRKTRPDPIISLTTERLVYEDYVEEKY